MRLDDSDKVMLMVAGSLLFFLGIPALVKKRKSSSSTDTQSQRRPPAPGQLGEAA